jgi:hypothetical protein
MDIDRNPAILKKFDKIIVLHNEYVTKKEFNAIALDPLHSNLIRKNLTKRRFTTIE